MGLNRSEELIWGYVQTNPEERQHWKGKVQTLAKAKRDRHELAGAVESELRRYFDERCHAVKSLGEKVRLDGLQRSSMRNLAEYLLQVWAPIAPKSSASEPKF
jgi:hypothetical protein